MGALPGIELPVGLPPHIDGGQIRGICGAAKEVGHRVVGGESIGAGGVISPAYGVAVRLEPRAIAGSEQGEGSSVRPGSSCLLGLLEGKWP